MLISEISVILTQNALELRNLQTFDVTSKFVFYGSKWYRKRYRKVVPGWATRVVTQQGLYPGHPGPLADCNGAISYNKVGCIIRKNVTLIHAAVHSNT